MTITTVQAKVTKTAAFNGADVDISGIATTADWTLVIEVLALNAANVVRLAIEDTVNAFSAKIAGPAVSLIGAVTESAPKRFTFTKKDFPGLRFGVTSAALRLAVAEIKGGDSQSITYQAWLET